MSASIMLTTLFRKVLSFLQSADTACLTVVSPAKDRGPPREASVATFLHTTPPVTLYLDRPPGEFNQPLIRRPLLGPGVLEEGPRASLFIQQYDILVK